MKINIICILTSIILLPILFVSGCGTKAGTFGQPITETNIIHIGDILAHPEQYDLKTVLIEGRIIEECPTGGWFILKDETGILYVDLHPSYFAIPQTVGRHALAQGTVRKEESRVSLTGKGVQIK